MTFRSRFVVTVKYRGQFRRTVPINSAGLVHSQHRHHVTHTPNRGMEKSGHRPATAGAHSDRRQHHDSVEDDDGSEEHRSPARPSTQRSGRNSPRTENVASGASLSRRRESGRSGSMAERSDPSESMLSEIAILRQKLSENELAKAKSQVQLKRKEAEMAKLERYITQLVDERGGVDASVMETIVKDMEKSSIIKKTQKQLADLTSDLRRKQLEVDTLKSLQKSEDVLKLAEEKEALAMRVEQLITEKEEATASLHYVANAKEHPSSKVLAELERLRAQNSAMRAETAHLRANFASSNIGSDKNVCCNARRENRKTSCDGRLTDREEDYAHVGDRRNRQGKVITGVAGDGPRFYEGQAVECRRMVSESWSLAVVDEVISTLETLGGGDKNNKSYIYTLCYDGGGREDGVQERRIRTAQGEARNESAPALSAKIVRRGDGEIVIRQKAFRPGDEVLARDTSDGRPSPDKWTRAEVVRRNSNGTYIVVFDGTTDEVDLHPTMLRMPADHDKVGKHDRQERGGDSAQSITRQKLKVVASTPAEEAELRYDEQREALLEKARAALPGPLECGREVLAKYPRLSSKNAWGVGVVAEVDDNGFRCSISFNCGDFETNIPCVFVRPTRGEGGVLSRAREQLRQGDAVLAQRDGAGNGGEWFPARIKEKDGGRDGMCSVVFVEEGTATVPLKAVYPLYLSSRTDGQSAHDRPDVPGNPPPPTKPVRAKKHREGDIVLACVPKLKAWTPAVITGAQGRGRYSVEWADGTKVESLLFMHIASLVGLQREYTLSMPQNTEAECRVDDGRGGGDSGGAGNDEQMGESKVRDGDSPEISAKEGRSATSRPKTGGTQGRLRQRQLSVGEPVLAKLLDQDVWAPGCIKKVHGGGKYDVDFTNGAQEKGLSFLYIRGLTVHEVETEGGGCGQQDGDSADETAGHKSTADTGVGDSVYVLRRGHSTEHASYDLQDRDLWRMGTVTAKSNGRFTVRYGHEEGKPQEARIVPERIRARQIIRQKAAEKGDVVLALSKIPGRGWQMGAVASRRGGRYTIIFADGTEEKGVRFVNLRRVADVESETGKTRKPGKPAARAIRQRRFHADEVALARHPDTRKWGVVKVLEAHPSGRYDLEFLGNEGTIIMGAAFTSMRHLDLTAVASDNPVVNSDVADAGGNAHNGNGEPASHSPKSDEKHRRLSEESWDDHQHSHAGTNENTGGRETRNQYSSTDGGGGNIPKTHKNLAFDVGAEVYVLRRGKNGIDDLQDKSSWRHGRIIAMRSTGTFAVQYDQEEGSPKEDRVVENRLRVRRARSTLSSHRRHVADKDKLGEGDVVLAREDGAEEGNEGDMATTIKASADLVYRVEDLDGSAMPEVESDQLSHLNEDSGVRRSAELGGAGLSVPRKATEMRKLHVGELVVAKRPDGNSDGGKDWSAGKIVTDLVSDKYGVLFAGEAEAMRIHITRIRPVKIGADEGNLRQEENEDHRSCQSNPPPRKKISRGNDRNKPGAGADETGRGRGGRGNIGRLAGVLRVAEVAFNLSMAASAARRTSPRLVLATGERGEAAEDANVQIIDGGDGVDDDSLRLVARGSARAGTLNPEWKGKDSGTFWLSLAGLTQPELYVGVEDARGTLAGDFERGGKHSQRAIIADVCIPVPEEGVRAGTVVEVELNDGAGTVTLEWGTHDHAG